MIFVLQKVFLFFLSDYHAKGIRKFDFGFYPGYAVSSKVPNVVIIKNNEVII